MSKSLVFISHIEAEKEIAIEFKNLVELSFLGLIDVFVSSDGQSIEMGQRWLNSISDALKSCSVEVVVCSPESVVRPWINFEVGAGWIKDIPVISLCHSGITPSTLPIPLNLLQGAKATDVSGLNLIFPVLARAIGSRTPTVDFTDFVSKVEKFEEKYTFWNCCNEYFSQLRKIHPQLVDALRQNRLVEIDLTEPQISRLEPLLSFFEQHELMKFERIGNTKVTPYGMFYDFRVLPLPNLSSTMDNLSFSLIPK